MPYFALMGYRIGPTPLFELRRATSLIDFRNIINKSATKGVAECCALRSFSEAVPKGELNWNGILRNIREIKDLLQLVLPEAGIIPDFSTIYA